MENITIINAALPLSFSDKAIDAIKKIIVDSSTNNSSALRVGVKGGGCTGLSYVLEVGLQEDDDEVYEIDGITILLKPAHQIYLKGMNVEYDDGLNSRGFTFKNPNATKSCGCGSSFAV